MIVSVSVKTYHDSKYHGSILLEEESFRVQRKFPWQKWTLLDEFGCGYQPGDEWESFPIKPNQTYDIKFGDGHHEVITEVIQERY